ncbi:SLC13 family permease [Saccharopolyspora gloriosae]|uniref:Anion transporter n=1 Tax=Saccharopolyspora gloriosae TaxID=455344 RepID=A0A840NQY6_9PSEU|nr:SLC13 family permease [Saccharopolyspora gloriosae]MBB5070637.1 anion transporter [Saccharopolyspora gloriosae]
MDAERETEPVPTRDAATRVRTDYATRPMRAAGLAPEPQSGNGWAIVFTLVALGVLGVLAVVPGTLGGPGELGWHGLLTFLVFAVAVGGWMSSRLDDTFVAVAAAVLLVLFGVLDSEDVFEPLGEDQIWLLIAAFILAAGINATGLPARLSVALVARARRPRGLFHLITASLVITALLVPSTSGRAALVLPFYLTLAAAFAARERLVRALAVLFPTVVLLSAVASLVGAGAHLVTSEILASTVDVRIGFAQWLWWGLPFAVASSHLAAELVLALFTRHADRRAPLRVDAEALRSQLEVPERMRRDEIRAAALLGVVVLLWSTEPLHGLSPALVALGGAVLITSPRLGTVRFGEALSEIPWSLLLFMAATGALGTGLTESGAAQWAVTSFLSGAPRSTVLLTVVVLSVAAHLVVQSRSARSSVLIPLVVPAALAVGMNPVALAFASTAAAGFCHTLPSSAKPVAMFARIEQAPTFAPRDLLKLSALLGPVMVVLVLLFTRFVWPTLGLDLD